MAERSGYFLPGLVKGLLAAIAAMAIALSAAQAQSTCTADSNCTGVDEACVFGRCLQVSYNADWECTNRLPCASMDRAKVRRAAPTATAPGAAAWADIAKRSSAPPMRPAHRVARASTTIVAIA
jgi:hypothetical protein